MPPKFDPSELKIMVLKTRGGEPGAASSLAPKMGPLGLNAKKVGDDIAKETDKWKGIKVMIEMRVQNRNATISVLPSASALLIKELNEKPRDRKKHDGNLTFDQVVKCAKLLEHKSLSKSLSGTVKQLLGTCQSLGCTVNGETPRSIIDKINQGLIDV